MRCQDQLVKLTQKSLEDFFGAVAELPADKVDWSPGGQARSALEMAREVAVGSKFYRAFLETGEFPFDPHVEMHRESAGLDTLPACRSAAERNAAVLISRLSEIPDDLLEEEVSLPFLGGVRMTYADVAALFANNLVYHFGQVNYIQSILGLGATH